MKTSYTLRICVIIKLSGKIILITIYVGYMPHFLSVLNLLNKKHFFAIITKL